jgi:hypothetical protein
MFPMDMVCLRNIIVDTPHKGGTKNNNNDDDDDGDNNNNKNNNNNNKRSMVSENVFKVRSMKLYAVNETDRGIYCE